MIAGLVAQGFGIAVVPQMELLHKLEVAVTLPSGGAKRAGKTTRPKAKGGLGARMGFRAQASGRGMVRSPMVMLATVSRGRTSSKVITM